MGTRSYGQYTVETSNEDKVFFPDAGLTKGDLIDYYERVADAMLPHLRDRALALERYPDGLRGEGFYQKQADDYFPDWVATTRVRKEQGGTQDLVVCDKQATLVYLANLACLTLHTWLSRTGDPDHPDLLVIDLDPPDGSFGRVVRAARRCRELLDELDLPAYVKTTGSKGLHVTVPLDRSEPFDTVRAFARDAMALLAERHPDDLTIEQRKEKREGRVYLDTGRNAYARTAVAPYAVRARPGAPVAAPLEWSELGSLERGAQSYTVQNVIRRLGQRGDPWEKLRHHSHSISPAARRLDRLRGTERH